MAPGCREREAGFSLVEVSVAIGLAGILTVVFAMTLSTAAGNSGWSNVALKVHEEHRRNLDSIATAMRGAAASSLMGFDASGTSSAPSYQCVTGMKAGAPILDAPRQISWRARSESVEGVAKPGELVVTSGGQQTVIARRVPAGGFRATLLGSTLRITLTTYSSGTNDRLAMLTGDT
jgi:prepilin-type N-terminal cleavage/methylation domain-containing protein